MNDKNLMTVLKGIPKLASLEQTRGFLMSVVNQWGGGKTTIRILFNAFLRNGIINTLKGFMSFKLDRLTANLFISMWGALGDREAIVSDDRRFTYREFKDRVFRLANGLQSLGLKPKDSVAQLLYNGNEFFEAFFAGSLIGCTMPCLNWHIMGREELAEAINRASPRALLLNEEFVRDVASIRDELKTVEHFIVVGTNAPKDMVLYEDLISRSSGQTPDINFLVALNPYTGGTTGTPKNVNYYDSIGYAFSDLADVPKIPFIEYLKFLFLGLSACNKIKLTFCTGHARIKAWRKG